MLVRVHVLLLLQICKNLHSTTTSIVLQEKSNPYMCVQYVLGLSVTYPSATSAICQIITIIPDYIHVQQA